MAINACAEIWRRSMRQKCLILLLSACFLISCDHKPMQGVPGPPGKWVNLKDCRLAPNASNDGDSFLVIHDDRKFIFRLYFADAPETDESVQDRVKEQCRYFGVTREQLRRAGIEARNQTAELLSKPFVVTTRSQDAMGRSQRFYAIVTVGKEDLAEILVARGLARAKGTLANLPDGAAAKDRMKRLKKLEAEAKNSGVGIWSESMKLQKPGWWQRVRSWFLR